MSRKCYCATSVKAVRAVEIRTARHPESINDNKRVKAKGGFFLEICQANGSDQRESCPKYLTEARPRVQKS